MNKLLNRTLLYYLVLSTVVLALSGPGFYWLIEKLYLDDVDETIILHKDEFVKKSLPSIKLSDIPLWNRFNRDIHIYREAEVENKPKDKITREIFFDEVAPEYEPYHVLYKPVSIKGQRFILMVRVNLVESEDLMATLTWLYIGILFLLLLANFYFTRLISNRLWQPFYHTLDEIEKFNIEQQTVPQLSESVIEEFKKLNTAISKLINDNVQAYRIQKEFTENASHELQTPLAVFQSKLDMLLQEPALNKNQAAILQSLYEAASRLSRMNKNLLLLAKIENNQYSTFEPVNLGSLVNEVLPYFREQSLSRNLQISTDITNMPVLQASKPLVEILVNNLILNAISHNHTNGHINIQSSTKSLSIGNTSDQPALDADSLFKRFSKFSKSTSSSGLGLSIIQQICSYYHWHVKYCYKNDMHWFIISF
jgi:signal transduction histidine kinase